MSLPGDGFLGIAERRNVGEDHGLTAVAVPDCLIEDWWVTPSWRLQGQGERLSTWSDDELRDGLFAHLSVWLEPVDLLRIREELAIGVHLRATDLYAVGSVNPDHDAVMRICGKAPGGGSILSVGIKCQVRVRLPATSDVNSAVPL